MTTLATVYASGHVFPWHCLSLIHPALPGGQIHWVLRWLEPLEARTETGDLVRFESAWFELSKPEAGGSKQRIEVVVSNVTGQVRRHVEAVRAMGGKIQVIYREYVPGHLDAPAEVISMVAAQVQTRQTGAAITATFRDAVNTKFPSLTYTQDKHPGLAYVNG